MSLQEIVLRAKPATVLVVSEVATEVALDCGAGPRKVTPTPFRETGTGWFVDSNGWVVTNAHVVQPAHQPPTWLINQQAQKAIVAACVYEELARQGFAPGERPDIEDELRRTAMARAYASARVEAKPSIFILMANGFRLVAKIEKYSPPVSTQTGAGVMSGRDLALLSVEASEMPAFKLAESKNVKIGDPIHILGFPGWCSRTSSSTRRRRSRPRSRTAPSPASSRTCRINRSSRRTRRRRGETPAAPP